MVVKCGFETTLNMLNAIFKYSIGGCGICAKYSCRIIS